MASCADFMRFMPARGQLQAGQSWRTRGKVTDNNDTNIGTSGIARSDVWKASPTDNGIESLLVSINIDS
jgi:hypothetical protein